MGEWTITIQGAGIHDNGRPGDVDALLKEFLAKLDKSQDVRSAVFTVGSAREMVRIGDEVRLAQRVPSDESRIRDAMAKAQDHPGRTVTR